MYIINTVSGFSINVEVHKYSHKVYIRNKCTLPEIQHGPLFVKYN